MPEIPSKFEAVIGLEVHAQMQTESKLFCACPNRFGDLPNRNICPVCTGQPGALPVINERAIELGLRLGLAVGGAIQEESYFARKNYFYPDLPKGYQISQYDKPFCSGGKVEITDEKGAEKIVRLTRIHFEEDAGKSIHTRDCTQIDLNRAGVPLVEIVTEPDLRSAYEAAQTLRTLRELLRYLEVCDGDMEKGNLRCDANVSIRPRGSSRLGTKVELKNINSFRFVEQAVVHEIRRQIGLLEQGKPILQETRGWDGERGVSEAMRSKEQAHDYRYFTEPDLPPIRVSANTLRDLKSKLPELPQRRRDRFVEELKLNEAVATQLTRSKALADFFETVVKKSGLPIQAANWILNELVGKLNAEGREIECYTGSADGVSTLLLRVESGELSGKMAKQVFDEMFETGEEPESIIKKRGLSQLNSEEEVLKIVNEVLMANPEQVNGYKAGKTKLLGFFVGEVMKRTKGQANPGLVNSLLKRVLK